MTTQEKIILSPSQQRMQKQCKYLGKESKSFNPMPSDRIYFGRYPYKVTLSLTDDLTEYVTSMMTGYKPPVNFVEKLEEDPATFDDRMAWHLMRMKENQAWRYLNKQKEEIQSLEQPPFQGERFYVDVYKHRLMCYLPSKSYLINVLDVYKDRVTQVRGPWNKKHRDMLIDFNTDIAVRKKPYWNKYNIKITARPSYKMPWNKRQDEVMELRNFFKANLDPDNSRMHRQRYGEVTMWSTDDELESIEPFLQLAHPGTRIHITRCFINK